MAILQQMKDALLAAHNAGDFEAARLIAGSIAEKYKSLGMNPETGTYDVPNPADTGSRLLAGIGKGMVDVGRGIGQAVGLVSRDDVAESRRLDEPLMKTGAGQAGAVIGNAAAMVPTAFIPGANTLGGAALIGAGTGFLSPSSSTGETVTNTLSGGVLAPIAIGAGRVLAAGGKGLKALVDPFFEGGQETIAARSLQRFASNPSEAAARLASVTRSPLGTVPTAAEVAMDPGIAQLQRTLMNNPDAGKVIGQRLMDNTTARVNALREIAGDEGQKAFFEEARTQAAKELYKKAFDDGVDPKALTPWLKGQVTQLLKRPAIQQASKEARILAQNEGIQIADKTSIQGLHYTKMALDDQISNAVRAGDSNKARILLETKDKLVDVITKMSPAYREALATFAESSKPINQMQIGQYLLNKVEPAAGYVGANKAAFGAAMKAPDEVARRATGFPGARWETSLSPEARATIGALQNEFAGVANSENLGRAIGSNTAQNLVSQNVMRQLLGPLGLPEKWSESAFLSTLMRPVQFAARAGEERVTPRLAEAMLDPQRASLLLRRAEQRGLLDRFGPEAARYLPTFGLLGIPAYRE